MGRLITALVLILLVACSGGKHRARGAAPTPTTTSTTAASSTTTLRLGPPPCTTAGLDISAGQGGGAAGHEGFPVLFKNTATKCRITGYPGVAGLDSAGRQATQAQRS